MLQKFVGPTVGGCVILLSQQDRIIAQRRQWRRRNRWLCRFVLSVEGTVYDAARCKTAGGRGLGQTAGMGWLRDTIALNLSGYGSDMTRTLKSGTSALMNELE